MDPVTGVHTNTIEGTWNGMKMHICRQHFKREFIDEALMDFIWRRRYADDLWNRLLHAMQHVIYDADAEYAENIDLGELIGEQRSHLGSRQRSISSPQGLALLRRSPGNMGYKSRSKSDTSRVGTKHPTFIAISQRVFSGIYWCDIKTAHCGGAWS